MIFNQHKCVFYHVPKTGGCSIEVALYGGRPGGDLLHSKEGYLINYQHGLPSEMCSDLWSFAFVRNPWDRYVSYYHHLLRLKLLPSSVSFKTLVRSIDVGYGSLPWARAHDAASFMLPQERWAQAADFVGRFETLQQDFNRVCQHLNIASKVLPRINATVHDHYSTYYDDESIAIVGSKYKLDVELYDYTFERNR